MSTGNLDPRATAPLRGGTSSAVMSMSPQTGYEVSLRDYWRILRKKKGTVILATALLGLLSFILAYVNKPVPLYRSTASVQIERTVAPTGLLVHSIAWGSEDNIETQLRIIESLPIMERVATRLGWIQQQADTTDEQAQAQRIKRILGLQNMVSASQEGFTNIVHVTAQHTNPAVARQAAQAVAEVYRDYHTEYRNRRTLEAKKYIENQRTYWKAQLAAARASVKDYQESEGIISVESNTKAILTRLAQAEGEYDDARFARGQTASIIAELVKQKTTPQQPTEGLYLEGAGPYIRKLNDELSTLILTRKELLLTLTEKHPRVVELSNKIQGTMDAIIRELSAQLKTLDRKLVAQEEQIESLKAEFTALAAKGTTLNELLRDVALKEDIYGMLESKYQEVLIKEAEKIEEVQIVAPALENRRPINPPNLMGTTFVGTMVGLVLGLLLAFVLETLDTSIGTIEDVEAYLDVPVLGIIPHVDINDVKEALLRETQFPGGDRALSRRAHVPTHFLPRSVWAESYRALRTNIQFINVDGGPKTILVSSSVAEEGKTTTLVNLGVATAQMGKNVLLVDADLRKPRVARFFGLPSEPGLSEIIMGNVDWREAVRTITDIMTGDMGMEEAMANPGLEHLSVITSGTIPPNPSELLSRPRVGELVEQLKQEYDMILFDSAPIIPATDAAVLASKLEGMVLVYQVGQVARGTLKRAKVQMDNVRTKVFGVVLNELRAEVSPDFQDMERYKYKYGYGYGQVEVARRGWLARAGTWFRRFTGWPSRVHRPREETELEQEPPKAPPTAPQKRRTVWKALAVALSATVVVLGVLWQTGYLAALRNRLSKPGAPAPESQRQQAVEAPAERVKPEELLAEPRDEAADIKRAIDSLIQTRTAVPAADSIAPLPIEQAPELPVSPVKAQPEQAGLQGQPGEKPASGYYVQWGAYGKLVSAQRTVTLLNTCDAQAFIQEQQGIYKVEIGPLPVYRDALAEGERLRERTGLTYWIVPAAFKQRQVAP